MISIMDSFTQQMFLRTPAHRFTQGNHTAYFFALDLSTADGLLPQRIDDQMVRDANRKLTPSHAKNIQTYLAEEDGWLLGALMLGISQEAVDFRPFEGYLDFGDLRIRADKANTTKIFDGQHRRRAIYDVLAELRNSENESSIRRLRELEKSSVTVVLYEEDDLTHLRQMFVDASKTKAIEPNAVARFNSRDAFNVIAGEVALRSKLFGTRIEMERSSVNRTSTNIASINQLVGILKKVLTPSRRISRQMNREIFDDKDQLIERALEWSDQFLPAAREEYKILFKSYSADRNIPSMRGNSFAVAITFLNLMAESYRFWTSSGRSWKPLADFMYSADIEIGSEDGLLSRAGLVAGDKKTLFSRRQELEAAARYIVSEVAESSAQ